jgi:hypothetical protein
LSKVLTQREGKMQRIVWALVALFAAAAAWSYRADIAELAEDTPPAKPIVFDNGTVRQYEAASEPETALVPKPLPNGVLRKCVHGREATTYTNVPCPYGFKEKPVDSSRVSVVPAGERPVQIVAPANQADSR